jgi:hypothetical protein
MAIMSFNMGDLTLKMNNLKNRLIKKKQEKVVLQEELDKEKYS